MQVAYIIATIAALDYLHDAWFYWTHRWLHSRLLYKHVHAMHHTCASAASSIALSMHTAQLAAIQDEHSCIHAIHTPA